MNGLIVLAVAVAVLGCCLVFAMEDDIPRTASGAPAASTPASSVAALTSPAPGSAATAGRPARTDAVVLDLRPRLTAAQLGTRTDSGAGSKRTRLRTEGGALRTTTLLPR